MTLFYVSPAGNDDWPGNESQPFATIEKAISSARASGGDERRIVLRGGAYYEVSVVLTPEDSGLTISAAPGETPVLYGGRIISDLRAEGHLWVADLPEVASGDWEFRHLLVNGKLRSRSKLPERGVYRHLSRFDVTWLSTTDGGWERKPTEEERSHLIYQPGDIENWPDIESAELTIYHQWDEGLVGIKEINEESHEVRFRNLSEHPPGAFLTHEAGSSKSECYVIWNVLAGLTRPGQWCLDRKLGRLYYWPLPGEELGKIEVIAPTVEHVIRFHGEKEKPVERISLVGLTVSATTTPLKAGGFAAARLPGAVAGGFTKDCRFEDLTMRSVGGHGIALWKCPGVVVRGCEVAHSGAGGIYCFAADGGVIEENHVHHVGVSYPSAQAMFLSGNNLLVAHNEIHDITYTAIGCRASDTVFENNLFYNVMTMLDDGAAIYSTFAKNLTIRGNVTIGSSGGIAHAYYLDEQTDDSVVERNLALNTGWPTHNHWAHNNILRENVFVDDRPAWMTFHRCEGFTLERNIFAANGGIHLLVPEGGIAATPNNVFSPGDGPIDVGAPWGKEPLVPFEITDGSIVSDPGFEDKGRLNITYNPDSPAMELGIHPIDFTTAGRTGVPIHVTTVRKRFEVIEPPTASTPGKARVTVTNLGHTDATGELWLWSSPSNAINFTSGDSFTYTLAPGEETTFETTIVLAPGFEGDVLIGCQTPDGGGMFKGVARVGG